MDDAVLERRGRAREPRSVDAQRRGHGGGRA